MPDCSEAQFLYSLMKDYHYLTVPALKALRAVKHGTVQLPDATVQVHRLNATGWFNHVAVLFSAKLLTVEQFQLVASKQAARLWLDYVVGLDSAVAKSPEVSPVEAFWRAYADGGHVAVMQQRSARAEAKKAEATVQ